jgi:hypothetical protein
MRWSWKWTLLSALAGVAALHFAVQIDLNSDQDECSFGPVANSRYRELLDEARRKQKETWPRLVRDTIAAGKQLNTRFDDLTINRNSVYERIAGMHAILRALGADYRAGAERKKDPYVVVSSQKSGIVVFYYYLDINRLGFFAPFRRRAVVAAGISGGMSPPFNNSSVIVDRGAVSYALLIANFPEGLFSVSRSEFGEICPPVPSVDQLATFNIAPTGR